MTNIHFVIVFFFIPVLFYFGLTFFNQQRIKRRWREAQQLAFSEEDRMILEEFFPPYPMLSAEEKIRLETRINYFLLHKRFKGASAITVTREMQLLIAAHACLIITNLEINEVYPGLKNIYVLESSYVEKDNPINPSTGLPLHATRLGESWKRGPIILSWNDIKQSIDFPKRRHNLIIHEFSHQLDQRDGHMDGTPSLPNEQQYHLWANVMSREFTSLISKFRKNQKSDIDIYGATNEAEFFAVCMEYFFTDPVNLERKHPDIFSLFTEYFKLDPRKWITH